MGRRPTRLTSLVLVPVLALVLLLERNAEAGEKLKVVVPDGDNLQFLSFWVAMGSGAFAAEDLDIEVVSPPAPGQTPTLFEESDAEAAVLPPPMYLTMIARRAPVVLVANLLANDPIELVVRRSIFAERKLDASKPLRERLEGIRGLRIGIAPHPPARLRALYDAYGLDADKDLDLVILHGKEQNAAFKAGEVDALFAHTPYVERAIVHDDAVVLVNLSRGEAPALANRMIHALAFKKGLLERRRDIAVRAYRAIARAEAKIHESPPAAMLAVKKQMPARDEREIATLVGLYEPAIPKSPEVRVEDLGPALALFPAGQPKPDLSGVPLTEHVATDLAREAQSSPFAKARIIVLAIGGAVVALLAIVIFRARRARVRSSS
jgi:ABC-type nitrate/sulfonate/bicarbonate transport system substrate-binding protein